MTDFQSISETKFSASAAEDGNEIVVRLSGSADVLAKPHLGGLFAAVDARAHELAVERVRVDIRQLAFMNSSCFKDFISWLDKVREAAPGEQYQVMFQASATKHWQRRSLHALTAFARGFVTIEPS
jgi:hypothetical protein